MTVVDRILGREGGKERNPVWSATDPLILKQASPPEKRLEKDLLVKVPAIPPRPLSGMKEALEALYAYYNRRGCIYPDPLAFVYLYENRLDREVAGFIASALAYGRVQQIQSSVTSVLDKMGRSPSGFLIGMNPDELRNIFGSFKHRFTTGAILSGLLEGLRKIILEYGSLESCFLSHFDLSDQNILPALCSFVSTIDIAAGARMPMFIPSPEGGSACKRLNLFLRWMVRRDNVDPGVWKNVPASRLVIPLDTHMHRIALAMGLTQRKQADLRCAVEVTENFAGICPEDPIRYDFALTRLGIGNEAPPDEILECLKLDHYRRQ